MEVAEATAMEAAIVWRAQTILETLQLDKLDAWFRRVGLAGGIGELKSEIERMETVVSGVKGRAVGNKPLARSLARVKELMYNADDVVDELDYYRIQQQVEGATLAPTTEPEGMIGDVDLEGGEQVDASTDTGVSNNSARKNKCEERDNFRIIPPINGEPAKAECIDCGTLVTWGHGTSVLRKHLNSARCKNKGKNRCAATKDTLNSQSDTDGVRNVTMISTNDLEARKRMRIEENVATTHTWNITEYSKRINEIALELQSIRGDVIEYLKDSVGSSGQHQSNTLDTRVRTSSSLTGEVYGRDKEKDRIIGVITDAKSDHITVLPIVGILGVGKTALARLVYNDPIIERQFERIWIWVSNTFDEVRVTREILDVVTLDGHAGYPRNKYSYEGVSNYSKLQEILKKHMACWPKRFLLVLDDVSDCMDNSRWKDLLDALGSSCAKGNVIIVTVRNLSVAQWIGTVEPIKLGALKNNALWLLFKSCVFGGNNYQEHLKIGNQIVKKLRGNPLAAESAAEMLREQPTIDHWKSIMKDGVWESLQLQRGIMTNLKIRFYHLPYHLQQCFLFCSIFPNNHQFHIDALVNMWISLGFVKSIDIGRDYLNALVNLCFFEEVEIKESILENKKLYVYVICGIMYEFARLVSRTEFATIDGLEGKEVLPTIRHFSVLTDSVHHKDEHGVIHRNVKFEEKLQRILSSVRRLRTLVLIGHCNSLFMLNSVDCTHLRYLKLESEGSSEALPISLSKFYHLEELDTAGHPAIFYGMDDLARMRHLVLTKKGCHPSSLAWLGTSVTCVQMIHLEDCEGWEKLPSLESLRSLRNLRLRNMQEVTEVSIPSVEELVLIDMPKLVKCSGNPMRVRDLNSSLRVLQIVRCCVLEIFPLLESFETTEIDQNSWLPHVSEFTIHDCPYLTIPHPVPPSSSFCKLSITKLSALPTMEGSSNGELNIGRIGSLHTELMTGLGNKILSFDNLKALTCLRISGCINLTSISLEGFRQLVNLERLEIQHCFKICSSTVPPGYTHEHVAATNFDAGPSLKCLSIKSCGITGEWLSVMLQHVRTLEELCLESCQQILGLMIEGKESSLSNLTLAPHALSPGNADNTSKQSCPNKLLSIPSHLIPSLKKMAINSCRELTFQGNMEGFSGFTSLEHLGISGCPKLISSLVHKNESTNMSNGRWLLPCFLGVLHVSCDDLEMVQPCFPGDLTLLTELQVSAIYGLKSLWLYSCTALEKLTIDECDSVEILQGVQSLSCLRYLEVFEAPALKCLPLHSCTALEELIIQDCPLLDALEGVQTLRCLRFLDVCRCPGLAQCLESLSTQGYELCPQLETLWIDDSFLTISFCKHLTSLQRLQLKSWSSAEDINVSGLTGEQETALQLLTSLQDLRFFSCHRLSNLPVGLHSLSSLKRLEIVYCPCVSSLPTRGLPPSLEELEVSLCSEELNEQCRMVASKVTVKIDDKYVY